MKVILVSNNKPAAIAIKLFTWSKWHHGGIILDDYVIEATMSGGVVKTPLDIFMSRYNKHKIIEVPHEGDYLQRAERQVGKSYDIGAIFKFVFRGDWSSEDKWFCFELIAFASGVLNPKYLDRVTATHLLMISKPTKK